MTRGEHSMKIDPQIPEELMRLIGAGMQERAKKEQADKVKNYRILNACAKKAGSCSPALH